MTQLIEKVRDGSVIAAPAGMWPRDDFAPYGEPARTKH
jgi:hypothetical protein